MAPARGTSTMMSLWPRQKDKGYCWVVLVCCLISSLLFGDFFSTNGIFFNEYKKHYPVKDIMLTLVIALKTITFAMAGVFFSKLWKYLQPRGILMLTWCLIAIGYITCMFVTKLFVVIIMYGLIPGFGLSLLSVLSTTLIPYCFEKHRSLAYGLIFSGQSIGGTLMPLLLNYLFTTYGLQGALLLMCGVHGHVILCALLLPPKYPHKETSKKEHNSDLSSNKTSKVSNQELQRNRIDVVDDEINDEQREGVVLEDDVNAKDNLSHEFENCCSLFTCAFTIQLISGFCFCYAHFSSFTFVAILANEIGFSNQKTAALVSTLSISSIIFRPMAGLLMDFPLFKRKDGSIFSITSSLSGLLLVLLSLNKNYAIMMSITTMISLLGAFSLVTFVGSILNIAGARAMPFMGVMNGSGFFAGIIMGGVILEMSGTCVWVLRASAAAQIIAGLLSFVNFKCHRTR